MNKIVLLLALCFTGFAHSAADSPGNYFASADSLKELLAPAANAAVTNTIYKGQSVEVFEVKNGWARVSKYYDGAIEGTSGQVARWVSAQYLSDEKPTPASVAVDNKLEQAIKGSDDFSKYRPGLVKGSQELISSGKCTLADFTEMGGWMRSVNHKPKPVYFTYCGGMKLSNKIYLNVQTTEIFK
ncbi:SH3 domain-containing protein [Pseudomonas sp. AOB-7]|uniref:SH3 domain-containing protein n=1 Tax=Pseudomonas sp. AOB-7 TaxID=2482750 RepID=UPI000EFA533E|nr:SH3 domain-containing protein [Pseudomonas sp. AOB-7]RMH83377.1 SH3 domain-containing protein [Pseudomonas sp. AOB-7]